MKIKASEKRYEVLGRELTARIAAKGLSNNSIIQQTEINENSLKATRSGNRGLESKYIEKLAKLLLREDENLASLCLRLHSVNKADSSLTNMLHGFVANLRIGYLDSPPFAFASRKGPNHPKGLLVQLLETILQLLRVHWDWQPIPAHQLADALDGRQVDIITGFVLESPSRQTRANFMPLEMPFAIGINGLAKSPAISGNTDYITLNNLLINKANAIDKRVNIITVRGEIADEYFPALFPEIEPTIRDDKRTVKETIKYYIDEQKDNELNVVFADHMSCTRFRPTNANLLLKLPVGRFRGGFLLPIHDDLWCTYFRTTFNQFLEARLPEIGRVFVDHHRELIRFLEITDRSLSKLRLSSPSGRKIGGESKFWTLEDWLDTYWPREIEVPQAFFDYIEQNRMNKKTHETKANLTQESQ